jgi:PAS domain S-box-containing protein
MPIGLGSDHLARRIVGCALDALDGRRAIVDSGSEVALGGPYTLTAHYPRTCAAEPSTTALDAERLAAFIDAAPDAIVSTAADGELEYFNATWRSIVGDAVGVDLERVLAPRIHADDRGRRQEAWQQALRAEKGYEMEYRLESPTDGSFGWFLERGAPLMDAEGMLSGWVAVLTCIDDNKQREEALRSTLMERDHFFETVLHELRTPLAPISNVLQVLRGAAGDAHSIGLAYDIIQRQVRQLSRLVDDLLGICQQRRKGFDLSLRNVELTEVVQFAIESSRHLMDRRSQTLTTMLAPERVELIADPVRLGQVFANLLVNAAKYTPEGGRICVATEVQEARVCVRVSDDGIGIPVDQLSKIFERFARAAPAIHGARSGRGIGLAVARELVELHGGSIAAHSEGPGRGSQFTVLLPRKA